jgi:AAA+ ATPase superfamily predicted ATPase
MDEPYSPFLIGKTVMGGTFVDRENERQRLRMNCLSGVNTILISPRRWGKSSLVRQVARDMAREKNVRFAWMDLFHIRSEDDLLERLTEAVLKATTTKFEERMKDVKEFIRGVVPQIGFGVDPQSEFNLKLTWPEGKRDIRQILDMPEKLAAKKKIRLVICLDEFQNIANLPDPVGFQKILRASWQHQKHVCHVIYGSKRHMMLDIFNTDRMPFYRFGDMIMLEKIKRKDWVRFIQKRFATTKKKITVEASELIPDLMDDHSHFVQLLSHSAWMHTTRTCTADTVRAALEDILDQHDPLYHRLVDDLSTPQLNYLRAMLNGVEKMSAKSTIDTYKLGSTANVQRVAQALEKKEILDLVGKEPIWVDPMFRTWLRDRYWGHRLRP